MTCLSSISAPLDGSHPLCSPSFIPAMMAVSRLPSRHRRTPLTDVVVPLRRSLLLLLEWACSANTNADAAEGALLKVSNAVLLLPALLQEKDGERRDKANSDSAATEGMQRRRRLVDETTVCVS